MNQEILRLRRREFLKACAAAAAGSLAPAVVLAGAKEAAAEETTPQAGKIPDREAIRDVRTIIGTGWRGHTFPGSVAPFGFVQLSPDTNGLPEANWNGQGDYYAWQHRSGYHFRDNVLAGFSHTHLQGPEALTLAMFW